MEALSPTAHEELSPASDYMSELRSGFFFIQSFRRDHGTGQYFNCSFGRDPGSFLILIICGNFIIVKPCLVS